MGRQTEPEGTLGFWERNFGYNRKKKSIDWSEYFGIDKKFGDRNMQHVREDHDRSEEEKKKRSLDHEKMKRLLT